MIIGLNKDLMFFLSFFLIKNSADIIPAKLINIIKIEAARHLNLCNIKHETFVI